MGQEEIHVSPGVSAGSCVCTCLSVCVCLCTHTHTPSQVLVLRLRHFWSLLSSEAWGHRQTPRDTHPCGLWITPKLEATLGPWGLPPQPRPAVPVTTVAQPGEPRARGGGSVQPGLPMACCTLLPLKARLISSSWVSGLCPRIVRSL